MANRQARLSPSDRALKRETREIIAGAGGQERAAGFCRIGQQTLSDSGSPNVDRFLPVDALRDLEIVNQGQPGWPRLLRQVAAQIGCGVVELPEAVPAAGDWHRRIAQLTKEHSEAVVPLLEALADGEVSGLEVRDRCLLGEVDDVIQHWVNIRALLQRAAAEG